MRKLTLSEWASIGELVGTFAVFVSLVFLVYSVKQNTAAIQGSNENILFDGSEHHSIAAQPGMAERTILVSGVSKSFSWTGGRVGWAVLPTAEEAAPYSEA